MPKYKVTIEGYASQTITATDEKQARLIAMENIRQLGHVINRYVWVRTTEIK